MTFRPPNIPAGLGTKDPKTQEDLRRIRDALRRVSGSMSDLQAQINTLGSGGGMDAHAPSHENAGSDEIDVSSLSGVLADDQRADTIVETGGPTTLPVGAVADGDILTRSGSSIIGVSYPGLSYATPEIWTPPASPNAKDVEFDSSTLPSDFVLFTLVGSTTTIVTPISGVDIYTQPAATNVRIEANKDSARSWLLLQPRGEVRRWFYAKKLVLSGTDGYVFRARIRTTTNAGVALVNDTSDIALAIMKDDGSGNKPSANTDDPLEGVELGWESDGSIMQVQFDGFKVGAGTVIRTLADLDRGYAVSCELVLILSAGAASNTWHAFVRHTSYSYYLGTATVTNTNLKQGDTVWVGYNFHGVTANMPSAPILGADYLRFEDTDANFIP